MCGVFGIVTSRGREPSLDDHAVERIRDRKTHRGPDDAGLWRAQNAVFAHRRLSVIDPTPGGRQPMTTPGGRHALVYNGELYNDAELRDDLEREGIAFRTSCDTETVLHALARWGAEALTKFRGMYAVGFYDTRAHTLTLARDPLGVKPLYYAWVDTPSGRELVFASELQGVLGHPHLPVEPDIAGVSAYLTTVRTTIGDRTLFKGVRTLLPGEVLTIDCSGPEMRARSRDLWDELGAKDGDVRGVVEESVRAHLRSDVPMCSLLSGGLDSSVCAHVAARHIPELRTYCSGAMDGGEIDGVAQSEDFYFAQLASAQIGTRHTEAPVSRELFRERWASMVGRTGVPLSTPNEVAINEVARTLRAAGAVVTLSGEGADELFAGYEVPMRLAAGHAAAGNVDPGVFQLDSAAWVPVASKPAVLNEGIWRALEGDAHLIETYRSVFARAANGVDDPLEAHLRFHRRVNLQGLLLRLDSATMLESVEGRTPFADVGAAALADALPMGRKFVLDDGVRTKIALREAFAGDLPTEVVERPKASFPLPFQRWVGDARWDADHALVRELFTTEAIDTVREKPTELWALSWVVTNIALWAERWW